MTRNELGSADRPNVSDPVSEIGSQEQREVEELEGVHAQCVSDLVCVNEGEGLRNASDITKQRYIVNQYVLSSWSTKNDVKGMGKTRRIFASHTVRKPVPDDCSRKSFTFYPTFGFNIGNPHRP